jgi:hypothetical protein
MHGVDADSPDSPSQPRAGRGVDVDKPRPLRPRAGRQMAAERDRGPAASEAQQVAVAAGPDSVDDPADRDRVAGESAQPPPRPA